MNKEEFYASHDGKELLISHRLAEISKLIDNYPANLRRTSEALCWARLAKVAEEAGEVISAYIGVTDNNPRKGKTHSLEDVKKELLDTAVTALLGYEHVTENQGKSYPALVEHILFIKGRLEQ